MENINYSAIENNIIQIRKRMENYPNSQLMAVIKMRSLEEISFAINECGIDYVGENHAQEFINHLECLDNVKTDFIGTLQSNKVKHLVGKINILESVSTMSAVKEISKHSKKLDLISKIMVEVNIGKEPQKSGVMPDELSAFLDSTCKESNIEIVGLMTVPPVTDDSKKRSEYFSALRQLRDDNLSYFKGYINHPLLSMGMSDSYAEALDEGADIVRIGTGIFGPRKYTTTIV